jgi:hypothetical protein
MEGSTLMGKFQKFLQESSHNWQNDTWRNALKTSEKYWIGACADNTIGERYDKDNEYYNEIKKYR